MGMGPLMYASVPLKGGRIALVPAHSGSGSSSAATSSSNTSSQSSPSISSSSRCCLRVISDAYFAVAMRLRVSCTVHHRFTTCFQAGLAMNAHMKAVGGAGGSAYWGKWPKSAEAVPDGCRVYPLGLARGRSGVSGENPCNTARAAI